MRIKEKMGLVYSGLFLAMAIAVMSQNSSLLVSAYRGETRVRPSDDVINVRAGVDQRLFVLQNDLRPEYLSNEVLRLVSQPKCGLVAQSGTSLTYVQSQTCSGHQVFSYCLFNGVECRSAVVALRLEQDKELLASMNVQPLTDTRDQAVQLAFNRQDLEISNVHLGRNKNAAPDKMTRKSARLASVAVETGAGFTRPIAFSGDVLALNDIQTEGPSFFEGNLTDVADLTATTDVENNVSAAEVIGVIALPEAPSETLISRPISALPVVNLARFDDGFDAPHTDATLDASPFGTACPTHLTAKVKADAMVELRLTAPCQPNSRVQIRHGKLAFSEKTSHTGNLVLDVPAFEIRASFQIRMQDGQRLATSVSVPELKNFERLAIQWRGAVDLDLHALEFGAEPGEPGHVFSADQDEVSGRPNLSRGFLTKLGDQNVENPMMTEVYSLPTGPDAPSGVVEMVVSAQGNERTCGTDQALRSFLSKAGRLVVASGFAFKLPDCGAETRSIVLKNAVRDLIIASN